SIAGTDGRWSWEVLGRSQVDDRTCALAIGEQIVTRQRWRNQCEAARASGARAGPAPPPTLFGNSIRQQEERGVTCVLRTLDAAEGAHALDTQGDSGGASGRPEQAV